MNIMFFILINFVNIVLGFEFTKSTYNTILHNKEVNNFMNNLVEDKNKIKIVNNLNQDLCIDCTEYYLLNNNFKYDRLMFDDFLYEKFNNKKDYIIVEDFMINYGRILYDDEKYIINNYDKNPKIILHVKDYDNIVLKDEQFIKKFEIYNFPYINKNEILNYIYSLVDFYNYDNKILLINWKKYSIEKLNFQKLENLIYKVNIHINDRKQKIDLHKMINNELLYLNKKYYD